jgi:hypothetical protein
VANGITIVDSINGTPVTTSSNVSIQQLTYDFHSHYFSLTDQTPSNVTTGITLKVGLATAIYSPHAGYTFYYDTFTPTSVTITVGLSADALAIAYAVS